MLLWLGWCQPAAVAACAVPRRLLYFKVQLYVSIYVLGSIENTPYTWACPNTRVGVDAAAVSGTDVS
jgi:hypothetical protein